MSPLPLAKAVGLAYYLLAQVQCAAALTNKHERNSVQIEKKNNAESETVIQSFSIHALRTGTSVVTEGAPAFGAISLADSLVTDRGNNTFDWSFIRASGPCAPCYWYSDACQPNVIASAVTLLRGREVWSIFPEKHSRKFSSHLQQR